MRPGNVQTAID